MTLVSSWKLKEAAPSLPAVTAQPESNELSVAAGPELSVPPYQVAAVDTWRLQTRLSWMPALTTLFVPYLGGRCCQVVVNPPVSMEWRGPQHSLQDTSQSFINHHDHRHQQQQHEHCHQQQQQQQQKQQQQTAT